MWHWDAVPVDAVPEAPRPLGLRAPSVADSTVQEIIDVSSPY